MKRVVMARVTAAAALLGITLTSASRANAQTAPACSSLPNPVYVTGSSASAPVLQAIAGKLSALATPVTLVYLAGSESCQGVQAITNAVKDPKLTPTYYPAGGTGVPCTFDDPVGGQTVDIGVADVFPSTCPGVTLPATQKDFQGPVQAMAFVAHPNSTENVISAEAAKIILKYVGTAQQATLSVAPWTDVSNIFIRPGGATGSGTRAMIGTAVGLADADWHGTVEKGSGNVRDAVAAASAAANASLGILSVTLADKNRVGSASTTPLKILHFQSKGQGGNAQTCGYLPDSSAASYDKLNVREGRYGIWGPIHFITNVDGSGKSTSASKPGAGDAAVQKVVEYITMASTLATADKQAIVDATAASFVVPQCAMRVRRTEEVGAEASFQPDEPCGCYWESKANKAAPATCTACTADADCAGKPGVSKCRYGFCEAK